MADGKQVVGGRRKRRSCWADRYEDEGLQGLIDKRLEQVSHRRAPVDEVMALVDRYRRRHAGWNVKQFHAWYQRDGGMRSYTWVKNQLQKAGVAERASGRGKHRKRRTGIAWPGMMLHQREQGQAFHCAP